MKKLISTKMKVFMVFLLLTSITCFASSMVVLYKSDFKLSNYVNFDNWNFWNNYHNYYSYNNYDNNIFDEPLTDIINLNIDLTGYDVALEVHAGNNLMISTSKDNSNILNITNTDGTLNILPSNVSSNLLIKIPSSYNKNLDLKFTTGYTNISNLTLESLNIQGINSDIGLTNINCNSNQISTTNGDINLNNITSKELSADSLNGDIYSSNLKGAVNLKTISGNIFASLTNEISTVTINSTNGDVDLEISTDNNFAIDYNTVSGEFNQYSDSHRFSKYDVVINNRNYKITMGTGSVPVSITTVSGSLDF